MKILYLTLSHEAYLITGTPEKMFELRNYSDWIAKRLFNKDGTVRHYDFIEILDTYKKNPPRKRFEYKGVEMLIHPIHWTFSNLLKFYTKSGDFKIYFGKQIN